MFRVSMLPPLLLATLMLELFPLSAQAQTQLPTIVVTAPSPVQPKKQPAPGTIESGPATARDQAAHAPDSAVAPPAGTSLSIPADPSFYSVSVVTPQEMLRQPADTLGQALENKPGLATTSFAPGASRPIIRGLTGFRVSTQENGLSTGDVASLSDDHGVPIDPMAAGQVEVVRGPATLRYGSQAIGGVVNANNSRIPDSIPLNGVSIETRGGVSSADGGRNGAFSTEAGSGNFVLHADAFDRTADDYATPHGKQDNTSLHTSGNSIGGSFVGSKGFFGIAYSTFDSTYFIPGIEAAASKNHIKLNQERLSSKGEWRVEDSGIDVIRTWFGVTNYKHDEIDGMENGVPVENIGSTYKNKQYEGRVEVQLSPIVTGLGELRGAVGAQGSNRVLSGSNGLLPEAKTQNGAGYIFEELQVTKPLRLQAAARVENSDVRGTASTFPANYLPPPAEPQESPAHSDFLPVSYSAGLLYELPRNVVFRFTGQHVERAPDATELFYRGPHDATATFEIGNPNLTMEGANTFEAGLKRGAGDFRFDVSAYRTDFKNFIYKRFTGAKCEETFDTCGTGAAFDQIVYSQRNATFAGAEVMTEYDIAKVWHGVWGVQGQYDFVHATFEDGSYVPKIPPHRLGGGFYYYDSNLLARMTLLHAFDQKEYATFDTPTAGYNLLNAEVSYTMKLDKLAGLTPEMTIGLRGENLLNDDIRNAVSYKKDEVLAPGRSVRLFGSYKLN
jgi:iron complex outermembrane receptor protein